jgi:hypothetical protein
MPHYKHGSEPAGYSGGAAGHIDTFNREQYMKLQEGYIAIIPDDKSYVGRMQKSISGTSITDTLGMKNDSKYASKPPSILDELAVKRDYLTILLYQ